MNQSVIENEGFLLWVFKDFKSLADIMGVTVKETTRETNMAIERVKANSRNNRPTLPPINKIEIKFAPRVEASNDEADFKSWIESSGRVGYEPKTKSIVAFNSDASNTERPKVSIAMARLNILMGNKSTGEPLIDIAVLEGVKVELICPNEEKDKWQSLLEEKVQKAKNVAGTPKPKTLNLAKALDNSVKSLMNPESSSPDGRRIITATDIFNILSSPQTATDIKAVGEKIAGKASDTTDTVLEGAVELIKVIPDNVLGKIFKSLPTPIPGISLGTAAEVISALKNLNDLRHSDRAVDSSNPLADISKILEVVIPSLNQETVKNLLGKNIDSKK